MKYKEKPITMKIYLFDRQVKALEKLSQFQEISKSNLIRNLIDKAAGYKPNRVTGLESPQSTC